MVLTAEQSAIVFFTYPPIGDDDWRYAFATGQIRVLESQMLPKTTLLDMANAESFVSAVDLLGAGEYALPQTATDLAELESILQTKRSAVRNLFAALMIDKPIVELIRTREDFANMRLVLRRKLTDKPVGDDYSPDGAVPSEQFQQICEEENYSQLPLHMQKAIDRAVLAYYQQKDIRQIDYALDAAHAEYSIEKAQELKSIFLLGLFRIIIDSTNIRTMLRLKFTESERRDVFLNGGYIEHQLLKRALDLGYEAIGQLFFATPYYEVVEAGITYLTSNKSFLRLEQRCDEYLTGFLRTAFQITAGYQPLIAYLLLKESEIRKVRLVLTAKKNSLDTNLILERLGN